MLSTNGDQPRGTRIIENLVHENGHFSKQASPYFQAKAAQTVLQGNIFFNGPVMSTLLCGCTRANLACRRGTDTGREADIIWPHCVQINI